MNEGRLQAVLIAGHAGAYFHAVGRWPTDRTELEAFDCPQMDGLGDFLHPPPSPTCSFLAQAPYRIAWQPAHRNLRMTIRDNSDHLICSLTVEAPDAGSASAFDPIATIRTSVFSCPGFR